jgi:homoserine O-acetyltransferase/O-succinyltransferase
MQVAKKRFACEKFLFEAGVTLPVEIGYETYGTLSEDRSNAILICHYFSGTSDAVGWWGSLIGPGKAFDTDRFFIISSDVISNLHPKSAHVITSGPATINPETGQPYGLSFPKVTIRDFVQIQRKLLESMGIENLYCVAGPSMGGMQALQWAVEYPEAVRNVITVVSTGRTSPYTSVMPLQIGIDAILQSPDSGLQIAAKALTVQSDNSWAGTGWRETDGADQQFHAALDEMVRNKMMDAEPYHWLYLARASQSFYLDAEDLSRIQANVLAIPCDSDRLFPPKDSLELVEQLRKLNKHAHYHEFQSERGHLAGVVEGDKFAESIVKFLD